MLKIGVLGASELAKDHIRILLELKNQFQLIGFYDPCDEASNELIKSFSIERFESYEKLLNEVDCIDIVSPTVKHHEFATLALRKSKHIFIEKPLTHTIDEAKSLISLSREASVKVQIGSIDRFNSAFLSCIPFLNRPMYIETNRMQHYSSHNDSVSVVMDLMMNDIDVILSVVKSGIRRIAASGVSVFNESLDIVNARIEFDNGCVANLTASKIAKKNRSELIYFQKDSNVSVDFLANEIDIVGMNKNKEFGSNNLVSELPEVKIVNSKLEELKSFYESIVNDIDPIVSLADGYNSLKVTHKILELLIH